MKWMGSAGVLMALIQVAMGDSAIQQAQEALKEQGYYYGQVTGEKNADTTAAIRRYQIRNGLQVTGELNEETTRSLNSNANSSAAVQTATPAPQTNRDREEPEPRDYSSRYTPQQPQEPGPIVPRAVKPPVANDIFPAPPPQLPGDVFAETPYAMAPPQLQRQVVLGVETSLRRRGMYRGAMDGVFGPELEASLRGYQTRVGLLPSGRLDMDTLASLGLLPGQRGPFAPRRRSPFGEPPVRGEWIH